MSNACQNLARACRDPEFITMNNFKSTCQELFHARFTITLTNSKCMTNAKSTRMNSIIRPPIKLPKTPLATNHLLGNRPPPNKKGYIEEYKDTKQKNAASKEHPLPFPKIEEGEAEGICPDTQKNNPFPSFSNSYPSPIFPSERNT